MFFESKYILLKGKNVFGHFTVTLKPWTFMCKINGVQYEITRSIHCHIQRFLLGHFNRLMALCGWPVENIWEIVKNPWKGRFREGGNLKRAFMFVFLLFCLGYQTVWVSHKNSTIPLKPIQIFCFDQIWSYAVV